VTEPDTAGEQAGDGCTSPAAACSSCWPWPWPCPWPCCKACAVGEAEEAAALDLLQRLLLTGESTLAVGEPTPEGEPEAAEAVL
jgi:hypothetical protein